MTRDADFKRAVRARMATTGETYTAARAQLERTTARREQERVVGRHFHDGRLLRVPARRKARAGVLLEVLTRFEPGRTYLEPEVNDVLARLHDDVAYLRRELVNYRYLQRSQGRYRVVDEAPVRAAVEQQEIPEWEAVWLPGFLSRRA